MNSDLIAQWERVQIKTFTKWTNMHLAKCGRSIEDVTSDLKDGVNLIHLLQVISDETIPRFNKAPKMRIQMIENLNTALKFIAEHDVKLASIGSEAICDGDKKLTLGMIWTIILRFAISDLSEEGVSAKQGLLLWVQKKTQGYNGVNVQDFSESFKDGLAFDALIHKHRPDLLDFDSMDASDHAKNLDAAFDAAEQLGVPKLLDTADIVSMPRPDERSIMTYCAALYKVFSSYDKVETAAKRLNKYLNFAKQAEDMKHEYIERATALTANANNKMQELDAAVIADDYQSVRTTIADFKEYRRTDKRTWTVESSDLASLFSNIQAKLRIMGRSPFVPPAGLLPTDLEDTIEKLTAVEIKYRNTISEKMRAILDRLRRDYADIGNALHAQMTDFKKFLAADCEQPLDEQPALFSQKREELVSAVQPQLEPLEAAEKACDDANIDENEYCPHTFDDIKFMFEQLLVVVDKKLLFINSQIMEAKGEVSADKILEFRESFERFDSDRNGVLNKLEFRSAATSLGLLEIDFSSAAGGKEADDLFAKISGGADEVTFEQWVSYMTSITEDACTLEQAGDAFKIIADGKEWITEADIQRAALPADQVEFIRTSMQKNEHGYDYKGWLEQMK